MNIHFQNDIPAELNDNSRVWIYQSNRKFSENELLKIEEALNSFMGEWNSHGSAVSGFAKLFFGQFIVVIADETSTKVGGCSTDSLLRFIKSLEDDFNITLTDRLLLAFIIHDKVELLQLEEVNLALEDTLINSDTLYFNNTILTKADLLNKWIIPLKDSWLAARLSMIPR